MVKFARAFSWILPGLVVAVLTSAALADVAQPGFTATLSSENKAASGIAKLTEPQRAALDQQVQREIATARQGDTVAFATSFTHRRTPQQRVEAGLDHLMTPELTQLDHLVAVAVANRPTPTEMQSVASLTTPLTSAPWVEITPRKMEIHGEMSLTYVSAGSGRNGYGASVITTATDPSGKFSITVGLSQFHGKGLYHPYEYDCDRGW
jgi:hypothetical protein